MTTFLRTQDVSARIAEIIRNAENSIILISPFIKINDALFGGLKDAGRKGVKITLVFGKEELKPDVKEKLAKLDNISVFFRKTLHAKCFYNEKQMIITSMNLYDFSEVNNLEMGVLINAEEETSLFNEVKKEAESVYCTPIRQVFC
jgi:phosphatidylserine/phosphatidylglycerophosphate/cardiolipin synthase-like enzyme